MEERNNKIKISVITSLKGMEKIRSNWNRIFRIYSESTPFQSWEWNYGIAKTYDSSESLRIIVGSNNKDEIIGLAPLKLKRYLTPWMKVLEFIGTGPSDYLDIITNEEYRDVFFTELFKWIKQGTEWHIINFVCLRKEVMEIFSKHFQLEFYKDVVCPYITLPTTFEDYKKIMSKELYKYVKRNLNKLMLERRLTYSVLNSSRDIDKDINSFMDLHQKRQNTKGERGRFYDNTWRKQFIELSTLLFNAGILKVGILKIDSKFASIHVDLVSNGKEYAYLFSMNPEFAKLSPGSLLIYLMIEDSIKRGTKIYDFTRGSEPYKYKWAKKELQLYKAITCRTKLHGFSWKAYQRIKYIIYNSKFIKKIYHYTVGKIKFFSSFIICVFILYSISQFYVLA